MDKYSSVRLAIYERCESGMITPYEREILLEAATDKLKEKVSSTKKIGTINKLVSDLQSDTVKINKEVKELSKTWNYKPAIQKLQGLQKDAKTVKAKINAEKGNVDEAKLNAAYEKVDKIDNTATTAIKALKKADLKKQTNRFNNKYWIDYTKKHNQAFQDVEKELLGHNTESGKKHDMDKYIMYHFLPAPIAHALHVQFSHHHTKHAKTEEDYRNMMIDMECNRRTKPDKQMKPYQVIDKFYPDLKPTMDPILEKYGLPRNAKEDKMMELQKKLGVKKKPFKEKEDKKN